MRGVRTVAQVDEGAGIDEHAPVKLGMKPRHRERHRAAGAAAQRGAGVGIPGESHVVVFGDARQHLLLDELGVFAGDGVVFEAALVAGHDHDSHHHGQSLVGDHVVQNRGENGGRRPVMCAHRVVGEEQGRGRAGDVLRRNVHNHLAVGRVAAATGGGRIEFTVGKVHVKRDDLALRDVVTRRILRRGRVGRGHGIVAITGAGFPSRKLGEFGDGGLVLGGHRGASPATTAPATGRG